MKKIDRNTKERQKTIAKRQNREKEVLLEQLRKMPVISIACERANVGRTTFHRWIKEDAAFEEAVNDAMSEGDKVLDDVGKTQLVSLMKDKKWEAVKYFLEKHHPEFLSEKAREARDKKSDIKIILLHDNEA
jgi:hypothetical protein